MSAYVLFKQSAEGGQSWSEKEYLNHARVGGGQTDNKFILSDHYNI